MDTTEIIERLLQSTSLCTRLETLKEFSQNGTIALDKDMIDSITFNLIASRETILSLLETLNQINSISSLHEDCSKYHK